MDELNLFEIAFEDRKNLDVKEKKLKEVDNSSL
jgi:hypothetical protein